MRVIPTFVRRSPEAYAPGPFVDANMTPMFLLRTTLTRALTLGHTSGIPILKGRLAVVPYPWTRLCRALGRTELVFNNFNLLVPSMVEVSSYLSYYITLFRTTGQWTLKRR